MGIIVGWEDETERIMRFDISEPWTLDDLWRAQAAFDRLVGDDDRRIDLLVVGSDRLRPPQGLLGSLKAMRKRNQREAGGVVVLCSESRVARALMDMVRRLTGDARWQSARTREAGLAQVHRARATIAEKTHSRVA